MNFIPYRGHRILVVQLGPQFVAHVSSEAGILLALNPQPIGRDRTAALNEAMRVIDQSMS